MAATDSGFGVTITFDSGFFAEITNVTTPDMNRDPIETTHSTTTGGKRTFIPSDLVDHGQFNVDLNFDPDDEPPIDSAAETVTITFPTPVGGSSGATWQFTGFMTNYGGAVPIDDRMTASATVKVSGDITYTSSS